MAYVSPKFDDLNRTLDEQIVNFLESCEDVPTQIYFTVEDYTPRPYPATVYVKIGTDDLKPWTSAMKHYAPSDFPGHNWKKLKPLRKSITYYLEKVHGFLQYDRNLQT